MTFYHFITEHAFEYVCFVIANAYITVDPFEHSYESVKHLNSAPCGQYQYMFVEILLPGNLPGK